MSMLEIINLVTELDASPHDKIRIAARTMNQQTRLACTTHQDLFLVMDSPSTSMRQIMLCYLVMWKCPVESLMLERMKKIPISNQFQTSLSRNILLLSHSCSRENPSVEPQLQSSPPFEPPVPHQQRRTTTQHFKRNVRNVRARQSCSSAPPVPSSEGALAFRACSLEPACVSKKQCKIVGVEVSYPVTADMFENPEDDWLATASSRARARVEVNIKKLSSDERAQF